MSCSLCTLRYTRRLVYLANEVLVQMNEISQEKKIEPAPKHCFIKADLSLIVEAKRTTQEIRARAGVRGVDYLVLCQGTHVGSPL